MRTRRLAAIATLLLVVAACSSSKTATSQKDPSNNESTAAVIKKTIAVACLGGDCNDTTFVGGCSGDGVNYQTKAKLLDSKSQDVLDIVELGKGRANGTRGCWFTLNATIPRTTAFVDLVVGANAPTTLSMAELQSPDPIEVG